MIKTKRSLPFPLFLLILAVVSLGAWYTLKTYAPTPLPVGINEVTSTGTVTLEASPAPTNKFLGQSFTLDINAKSGPDKVTAVQLELVYDPAKLEVTNFTKTDYLPIYLVQPVLTSGKVTATLAAPPDSGGKADWGTIGKIIVKPLTLGTHSIHFNDGTLVATINSTGNALKSVTSAIITVLNLGDINMDKKIDLFDYNIFVAEYGKTGYSWADLNQSSKVDLFDYNIFVANYGKTSP